MTRIQEAASHLRTALLQTIPGDDRIIVEHMWKALYLLEEELRDEKRESGFLRAQLAEAVKGRDMFNAQLQMTIDRLGGIVEGNPTGRHNFLQRIDELVEIEQKHKEYCE